MSQPMWSLILEKSEFQFFFILWFFITFVKELLRFFELSNSCDLYFECLKRYFELVHPTQPCGGQKGAKFSTN